MLNASYKSYTRFHKITFYLPPPMGPNMATLYPPFPKSPSARGTRNLHKSKISSPNDKKSCFKCTINPPPSRPSYTAEKCSPSPPTPIPILRRTTEICIKTGSFEGARIYYVFRCYYLMVRTFQRRENMC